jgi:ferredoxin
VTDEGLELTTGELIPADTTSCGSCRDCGSCISMCPQAAISKREEGKDFELVVDPIRCIGCGFRAGACPCGIWNRSAFSLSGKRVLT